MVMSELADRSPSHIAHLIVQTLGLKGRLVVKLRPPTS